jgi:hypothetical protein
MRQSRRKKVYSKGVKGRGVMLVSDLDGLLQNCFQDDVEMTSLSTRAVISAVIMVSAMLNS